MKIFVNYYNEAWMGENHTVLENVIITERPVIKKWFFKRVLLHRFEIKKLKSLRDITSYSRNLRKVSFIIVPFLNEKRIVKKLRRQFPYIINISILKMGHLRSYF